MMDLIDREERSERSLKLFHYLLWSVSAEDKLYNHALESAPAKFRRTEIMFWHVPSSEISFFANFAPPSSHTHTFSPVFFSLGRRRRWPEGILNELDARSNLRNALVIKGFCVGKALD